MFSLGVIFPLGHDADEGLLKVRRYAGKMIWVPHFLKTLASCVGQGFVVCCVQRQVICGGSCRTAGRVLRLRGRTNSVHFLIVEKGTPRLAYDPPNLSCPAHARRSASARPRHLFWASPHPPKSSASAFPTISPHNPRHVPASALLENEPPARQYPERPPNLSCPAHARRSAQRRTRHFCLG